MKIGFCMLLWTTSVAKKHRKIIEDLKATGYDGVEIPVFGGDPEDYRKLGKMLDDIGLERMAIGIFPTLKQNPLSEKEADRKRAQKHLKWLIDCAEALGAKQLAGPLHQTLGHFTGHGPTTAERKRLRPILREAGDYAAKRDIRIVLEASTASNAIS